MVVVGESKYLSFLPVLEDDEVIQVERLSKTEHIIKISDPVALGMVAGKPGFIMRQCQKIF